MMDWGNREDGCGFLDGEGAKPSFRAKQSRRSVHNGTISGRPGTSLSLQSGRHFFLAHVLQNAMLFAADIAYCKPGPMFVEAVSPQVFVDDVKDHFLLQFVHGHFTRFRRATWESPSKTVARSSWVAYLK